MVLMVHIKLNLYQLIINIVVVIFKDNYEIKKSIHMNILETTYIYYEY